MASRNKIIDGLQDALNGNFAGATFVEIDWGSEDFSGVMCPRCDAAHKWGHDEKAPTFCRECGLEFRYIR